MPDVRDGDYYRRNNDRDCRIDIWNNKKTIEGGFQDVDRYVDTFGLLWRLFIEILMLGIRLRDKGDL